MDRLKKTQISNILLYWKGEIDVENKPKLSYDAPVVEVAHLSKNDIIATSAVLGWNEDNYDQSGWT